MKMPSRPISAVLVFAACSLSVLAQQIPQKVRFSVIKVKPDMVSEFRDSQAQATAAYKKAGIPWRAVWAPAAFGDQTKWITVVPLGKMSDWDSPAIAAAMGEAAYQQWLAKAARCVTSVEYLVGISRPEISIDSGGGASGLGQFSTVTVVLGKEGVFESKMKTEGLPALKKAGVKEFWVARYLYGGESTSTYIIAAPISSLGDLEEGSVLQRAMGPESFQRYRESLTGIVTSVKYEILRYLPELSYAPSK
jgi:hypothetical protein